MIKYIANKTAIEKVRGYFREWSIVDRIPEFDISSATVELECYSNATGLGRCL